MFSSSSNSVASRQVKLAAKAKSSQGEVWREVAAAQDKLSANVGNRVNNEASPTSFQLALENKEVQANADTYIKAFGGLLDHGIPSECDYPRIFPFVATVLFLSGLKTRLLPALHGKQHPSLGLGAERSGCHAG